MTVREETEALGQGDARGFTPAADWLDEGASLTLLLDVPGVEADSLEMAEDGDHLTVAGVRASLPPEAGRLLQSERRAGAFTRSLTFPEPVVAGSGEASLNAGILRVRFAKQHPTIDATYRELDRPGDQTERENEQ